MLTSYDDYKFHKLLTDIYHESKSDLYYVSNPGNAGDALIASGTWNLFDKLGIKVKQIEKNNIKEGMYILYGGGGNLIDNYSDCNIFLNNCLTKNIEKCVILPHTVRGHTKTLRMLDNRFTIICREYESYNWLNRNFNNFNIMIAKDLALNLDMIWIKNNKNKLSFKVTLIKKYLTQPKKALKYLIWKLKITKTTSCNNEFELFRIDSESTKLKPKNKYNDLSNNYISNFNSKEESLHITFEFLSFLDKFSTIKTNRLHGAIAGIILNKRVIMYDNSYGKNKSVFLASMESLENIKFIENT